MRKKEKKTVYREKYKSEITQLPGGFGLVNWNSFNCLTAFQGMVWLKICEIAYKTNSEDEYIHLGASWFRNHFSEKANWSNIIRAILDLEQIGYIKCRLFTTKIVITINYEGICTITNIINNRRRDGLSLIRKAPDMDLSKLSVKEICDTIGDRKTTSEDHNKLAEAIKGFCK